MKPAIYYCLPVALLAGSIAQAATITPVSYTYGANAESQPQPTNFQSGSISDVGNVKLNDDVLSTGGWSDTTNVGFRNDSDNGNPQPRIEFDLGGLYDVQTILVYANSDFGPPTSLEVSSSTDGINFSSPPLSFNPLNFSGGFTNGKLRLATLDVSALDNAQYIRLDFFDPDQWAMLNEVDFEGTFVPEPTSLALLAMGGLLIARRRRN